MQPFFNWLVIIDVNGKQLLQALEHGVAQYGGDLTATGRFLVVAGMTYTFDPEKPVGERVVDVTVDGAPLEQDATYTIVVNSFMADGGDGYTVLRDGANTFNTGMSVTDLLQNYIQTHSPITPPEVGRITHVGKE